MTSEGEYEQSLREAERELRESQTADDVRRIWRKYFGTLGHRALGRLLVGRSADELLARRGSRERD
jgi:hypothetical protein